MVSLLLIPLMGWLSRMAGGGWPRLPWGLDQWILASPYLLLYPLIGWGIIPSYLVAVLGLRLGHGRGFNYKSPFKEGSQPEKIEIFIPKNLPVSIQKFLIMFLTGLVVTLGFSISLASNGHWIYSLILALSGATKSLAYFAPRTDVSEVLRGTFLGIGLFIVLSF